MVTDPLDLGISGHEISRVCFDYGFVILTSEGAELRIQTRLVAAVRGNTPQELIPGEWGPGAAVLTTLFRRVIASASAVVEDGSLTVTFQDGTELRVPPHPQYEAWTFAGSQGKKVVCLPGGGLATWGPSGS